MYNLFRVAYYLNRMLERAYWSHDKLLEHQNKRLREIVAYAYDHVPFYHEKLRCLGIKPSDIRSPRELNKLPILTKEEVRKDSNRMISNEYDPNNLRVVETSGSTGRPLSVRISGKEDEFRKAKHLRANICCGQKPRDRWVVITPPAHHEETSRVQRLFGIYAFTPLSVFDDPLNQISSLKRIRPTVLDGYSSSLLLMAKKIEEEKIMIESPRIVIGGAELIDGHSRKIIENSFGAPFYDQYACVELERLASQCSEKAGYHIDADSVVMQFVDADGEQVAPGESGEIVCTSLFNYAMPFIRYAVGDIGRGSEEECPCGRGLPTMKVVEGRKDSLVVLPDGRTISPLVIGDGMMFFKWFHNIDQYRVIQKKVNQFKILVKKKNGSVENRVMEAELAAHFGKMLKVGKSDVFFEVDFVDEIPIDKGGKLMKIVSELNSRSSL